MNSSTKPTNFDLYLERQLADPAFAERFERAGEAWDVALQIATARERAGLSQRELAERLHTSQQQVSRLESPGYEGHSLRMLRKVAAALGAKIHLSFDFPPSSTSSLSKNRTASAGILREDATRYQSSKATSKKPRSKK